MLPAGHRLRRRADFTDTVRGSRGARGGRLVVVHLRAAPEPVDPAGQARPARVGFVVSRAVGPAVVRNRVKRRLRHLVAARLDRLSPGTDVVVRALPGSATASSRELAAALDQALSRTRLGHR